MFVSIGTKFTTDSRPIYKKFLYGKKYKSLLEAVLKVSVDDEEYKTACVDYDTEVAKMQLYCFYEIMNLHLENIKEIFEDIPEDDRDYVFEKMIGSALQFDYYRTAFGFSSLMTEISTKDKIVLNRFVKNCQMNLTSFVFNTIIEETNNIKLSSDIDMVQKKIHKSVDDTLTRYF